MRERVAERQRQAQEFRIAGASYRAIGARLSVSAMQAHRDVMVGLMETLDRRDERADQMRQLELERCDALTLALWPAAVRGEAEAVRAVMCVAERV